MGVTFSGINILAKDPEKSFNFYKGLGFAAKEEGDPASEWFGAELDFGGNILWIWRDNSGNHAEGAVRTTLQIVIDCRDIHESFKVFKTAGYDVTQPQKMFYGGWEMNLADPDGNKILFLG